MSNNAIDTASRFGDIPFVEFTTSLVTGIFDALVDAHILQMEEYSEFVSSLTQSLSTYINNTNDNVSFQEISDFILNFELPEIEEVESQLNLLDSPNNSNILTTTDGVVNQVSDADKWWQALISAIGPAVSNLVDKIEDPSELPFLASLDNYNQAVLDGITIQQSMVPSNQVIRDSIASLIVSNKYGILQTIAKQGIMRLVVSEGEIETKITFSTWNNTSSNSNSNNSNKLKVISKNKRVQKGGIGSIFRKKRRRKNVSRTITVNTAKSYQRDSSGTHVNIFGRVLIKFKSDYAPLNG